MDSPIIPPYGFIESIKICLRKYKDFGGRARRSEFWYFYIVAMIIELFFGLLSLAFVDTRFDTYSGYYYYYSSGYSVYIVFMLILEIAILIPLLAASTRRLHDTGRSGYFNFILLIPFGIFALWYFWAIDSARGANFFGPTTKYNVGNDDPLLNNPGVAVVQPVVQPIAVQPMVQPIVQTPIVYSQPNIPVQPGAYQVPPMVDPVPQQPNNYQGQNIPVAQPNYQGQNIPVAQPNIDQGQNIPVAQPNMYPSIEPQYQAPEQTPMVYPPPNPPTS